MRVLVNAVSIREGGPLVVLRNLLAGMSAQRPDIEWFVAGDGARDFLSSGPFVNLLNTNVKQGGPINLMRWYEWDLPAQLRKLRPAVLFSLTNYLPLRKLSCPTVLLEQHAGHFSDEFEALNKAYNCTAASRVKWDLSNAWVRRSVRLAGSLIVQTDALASRIAAAGLRPRQHIDVISHGPGQVRWADTVKTRSDNGTYRIGYITKYGVQKNFETLFLSIRQLVDCGRSVKLVLTLDPKLRSSMCILESSRSLGIGEFIENRGDVLGDRIEELYDSLDAMAFCSVCESFGFPMVEAMARGLPIVVADTQENREITGNASLLFAPRDHLQLAFHLGKLMSDEAEQKARSTISLARGREYSWKKACRDTLGVLEAAARSSP